MTPVLPVDSFIDEIRAALDVHRSAVLTAAPGAGKTTRVPPALIDRGRVLLLQPRRVAARAMAARIAAERGWRLGHDVGWHIRFDRRFTSETRLKVVTEGILTAYLQQDPLLSDVTTLILDEFHERNVHADLGIAMAKQAWLARSDLRILVMSATLDSSFVARFLSGAPIIDVPGTLHPLDIDYAPDASIEQALQRVISKRDGNILCFLPGVREIQQAVTACRATADAHALDLVPLHGSLDAAAQDVALSPSARRRMILATNIAETSLTVPGVSTVIDAGVHKLARYDPDRAVDALVTERITMDSADQRAGRAARLGPGLALRLWDRRDRLRPHREAEIHRVDLSGPLLAILGWGAPPDRFEWFDPPSSDRIAAALALLERLGAVQDGAITELGRRMQSLPLGPRLARVLIAANGSFEGAAVCAWLSEPVAIETDAATASSDLLPVLDRWRTMPPHLRQVADGLMQSARTLLGADHRSKSDEPALLRSLVAGYPDRIAKRRSGDKFTIATGHGASLARDSHVRAADWIVALDVTAGRASSATTEALIRVASAIDPDWLKPTSSEVRHEFNPQTGLVKAREIDWYDALPLREHSIAPDAGERARLLADAWRDRAPDEPSARLLRRIAFAGAAVDTNDLVQSLAAGATRVSDIVLSEEALPWALRDRLSRLAPDRLTVPSGRQMTIDYNADGSVSVAVKLQELFGLGDTPRIGPAATPITFHLLAPNGRPVQTTRDLKSFWERTYPEVRKELRGRYPRHPWPDDPWTATPTHRTKRR